MDTDNLRKWLSEQPVTSLMSVLEAVADELDGRVFRHAANRLRDARADLNAFVLGTKSQVQR